jgi:hypothetical protein
VETWLAKAARRAVFSCNDHTITFFFDRYPTFALGEEETRWCPSMA